MAGKNLKQILIGGPAEESAVDAANRMTKQFIDFHRKEMNTDKNPDHRGGMHSLADIKRREDDDSMTSPM